MSKLLSIVIPVYKVEPYINKCLDSLLIYTTDNAGKKVLDSKRMEQLDILIVNDGTPDRSAELSREYVKKYPKYFRQIDKENGGHGSVWNLGVKDAQGKYLRFLDSDDWLTNLDKLIDILSQTDADLVITPTIDHCESNKNWRQEILDMQWGTVYDADTFDWRGNRSQANYIFHHCCTYKTKVLRQYHPLFLEKQPYDDSILCIAPMIGAKSLVAYDFVVYHYLMDRLGQSISTSVRQRNLEAIIKAKKQIISFAEEHPLEESSTKYAYWKIKLPKIYSSGYSAHFHLPYKQEKQKIAEWDKWVQSRHTNINTPIIQLYRNLPFFLFRIVRRILTILVQLRRMMTTNHLFKKVD